MTQPRGRKHPLWRVYRTGGRGPKSYVYREAKTAEAALASVPTGTRVELVGDRVNRRRFPELFENASA